MGILNCTPDSFYDGGQFASKGSLIDRALQMVEEGADWIDVGGESTRPGAREVSLNEELERVLPVLEGIRSRSEIPLSIDTRKGVVGRAALRAGVQMINDVSGFQHDPELLKVTAESSCKVVMMHARGTPETMQDQARYKNVLEDVVQELKNSVGKIVKAGVDRTRVIIDPGFGFAKNQGQNEILLRRIGFFSKMGFPVLVGVSRKSFLGKMTGREKPADRLGASLAAALWAAQKGVSYLRVHDVAATKDLLRMYGELDKT